VVAPTPPAFVPVTQFGAQTDASVLGNEPLFKAGAAQVNTIQIAGIQLANNTTATVENNSVAAVGITPSTGGIETAAGIQVTGSTSILIAGNDVTDIGTDPSIAEANGVVVLNCAATTVSNNTVQQAMPALTQPTTFFAVLIGVTTAQPGQALVTGNQLTGTTRLGLLVGISATDCVFSANFCQQFGSGGNRKTFSQAVVGAIAKTFIASSNRIICPSAQLAMDIGPATSGSSVSATVLGNITSGSINLNGAALPQPWAPLNVIA
jgi:Right handed beta helix region